MKALKFTLLLASCTFLSTTFAQTLKPKQVPLANWNDDQGLFSYTYYEDPKTGDYIPHGKFSYKLAQGTYYKEDASGSLKNGKRDGVWLYKINRLDDLAFDVNWTGAIQLSFGYKEGNPNGLWTYSNIQKYRIKSRGAWLPYEFQFAPNETLSVMFTDGHPSGIYSFADNSFSNKVKITGQFNAKGFINGTWMLNFSDEQSEFVFNNGIMVKKVVRAMPSGKVSESYFASEQELKLHAAFLAKTLTKEEIAKNRIKIDTIDSDDYIVCDERKTIFSKYFNWVNLGGDNLYDTNRGQYLGGKAIKLTLVDLVKLEENKAFKELDKLFREGGYIKSRDTLELKNAFDEFYKNNRLSLTDEDYQKSLAIQKELKKIVIDRFEEDVIWEIYKAYPALSTQFFSNTAEEFEDRLQKYNNIISEHKQDSVLVRRIKKAWNNGVLESYSDISRFERFDKEYKEWMTLTFDKLSFSEKASFLKPAFSKMYSEYYLEEIVKLKNEKKYFELNQLVDKFNLVQDALFRIYYRDFDELDIQKIIENALNVKTSEDLFILLNEYYSNTESKKPYNYK
jgi:hypothetical protein